MTAPEPTLQERLAAVRAAAERDRRPTADAAASVLEARARQLARPAQADAGGADDVELLLVDVGDERLAIPVAHVVAIARPAGIAPLPRAVAPVHGVTPWRGRPITVLTLAVAAPAAGPDRRLVVLGSGSRAALAVLVDAVDDVARVPRASLTPAGAGPRRAYALGVTPDGILVVDGDALLQPKTRTS